MKKKLRLKKVKSKTEANIGKYELVKTTYQEADDGKIKVNIKKPIKIKLK